MLTRALASVYCRNGSLFPRFVATTPRNLGLCQELIRIYREALETRMPVAEMQEYLKPIADGVQNRRFVLALQKLLDDRSEYSSLSQLDFPLLRQELFRASADLLKEDGAPLPGSPEWRKAMEQRCPGNALLLSGQLYGDLPENDCLLKFEELTPEQLLERYNTGLVQAVLLSARKMTVTAGSTDAQQLRRLCQYLRFFQLLADIQDTGALPQNDTSPQPDTPPVRWLQMQIDGPASILEQTRRYGMQFATFFPALCAMPRWTLEALIQWDDQEVRLRLDESSGLKCPYHHFSAYVPDEIKLFQRHFRETPSGWSMVEDSPSLRGHGRELIFPDFTFRRKGSRSAVHLELFHRWHPRGLRERLAWLEKHPATLLVLGVERSLLKDAEVEALLGNSPYFQKFGFLYRDYPSFDKTLRALERRLDAPSIKST